VSTPSPDPVASADPAPSRGPEPQPVPEPALVAGLGNPGPGYAGNRHNAGAMIADVLAGRMGGRFKAHRTGCEVLEGRLAGRRVVLAKPRTYMNLSGGPVVNAARFYKIELAGLIVLHDELDLPFGTIRLKRGGGEGGHNGLRAISRSLGTKDYLRVRLGIDRPPGRQDPADYVLRDFSAIERKELPTLLEQCADILESLLTKGLEPTQNQYH
jgi:PTH1 family peptidyl-tRNA hydrolase